MVKEIIKTLTTTYGELLEDGIPFEFPPHKVVDTAIPVGSVAMADGDIRGMQNHQRKARTIRQDKLNELKPKL
jgi:hypothetical protein